MKYLIKHGVTSLLLLMTITLILIYVTNRFILTADFYAVSDNPLAGMPSQDSVVYDSLQKWIYLSALIYLLVKMDLISLILYTALYLCETSVPFRKVASVVTASEFIFLVPAILKIILFPVLYKHGTLVDWHSFYILSAITSAKSASADWYFALQSINIFEAGYWFLLAYGISRITALTFDRSLQLVLSSYLPALIVWITAVTFCSLMLFPNTR